MARLRNTITVDEILALRPCLDRGRIESLLGGRKRIHLRDIPALIREVKRDEATDDECPTRYESLVAGIRWALNHPRTRLLSVEMKEQMYATEHRRGTGEADIRYYLRRLKKEGRI